MGAPTTDRGGIQQVIRALQDAGWQLHYVNDGEGRVKTSTEQRAVDAITAVDQAWCYFKRTVDGTEQHGYVFFVLGNDPEEVVCDYTTNLDPTVGDLTGSWF